ncbi:MAG TPA: hypothetical protein G4N92_07975 [Anaerolineae bacterium]|nr:hypothetical protein [Anaerolineae bacterium]
MAGERIGEVSHFYGRISVAVINLSGKLKIGDTVHFLGHGADFQQEVSSMQIEHESIQAGKKGNEVAVKVIKPVKRGTAIFKLAE